MTLQQVLQRSSGVLGNERVRAAVIRSRGGIESAESVESLQDQIDMLLGLLHDGLLAATSAVNEVESDDDSVTIHSVPVTY